ncbi:MAG TPA: carboxymuconolactone decarboxylase family protein [Candidatus Binataceae bacterium]|nr:carboxymuconolactone decarboxylase family protein [Candidatus Binataceae bacterium]
MIPMLSPEEARKRFTDFHIADAVNDPNLATAMSRLNVFRALLQNASLTAAQSRMAGALMGSKTLNPRIRELVILRTGWRTKSEYEFCQHVAVARQIKMSDEEILGVRDPAKCKAYNDVDRAVIAMADELSDHAEVSGQTWSTLEKFFSHPELVELILVSGFWRMMAGFLKTAKIPLDPVDPTVTGWPEGKAP